MTDTTTASATDTASLMPSLQPSAATLQAMGSTQIVSLAPATANIESKNVPIERVRELAAQINIHDTQSIIGFGVEAQKGVSTISDQMLANVRTKDTGPVGEALNQMVGQMKGLDFNSLKKGQPGFLGKLYNKLLGNASALMLFQQKFNTIEKQVSDTQNILDSHRINMLRGVKLLDILYAKTLDLLHSLDEQVAAVQYKKDEVQTEIDAANAKAAESKDMADTQVAADLISARDALDRKLGDLVLTRQITIQALPSIRIVQGNEVGLSEKIQSQILNALPMWKRNIALTMEAYKTQTAAAASKAATDYTNELLVEGAKMIQQSNLAVRTEVERGIVDVDSVAKANESLINTINDTIRIAQEGKNARLAAQTKLANMESDLKQALLSAAQQQATMKAQ